VFSTTRRSTCGDPCDEQRESRRDGADRVNSHPFNKAPTKRCRSPSSARVRLLPSGIAEVEATASNMCPGAYTSMIQIAAETLGLPIGQVRFSLGRSDFPTAPAHGGSQTMASVGWVVRAACIAAQQEGAKRAGADQRSPVFGAALKGVEWNEGCLRWRGDPSPGQPYRDIAASAGQPIEASASTRRDDEVERRYSMHAFGAIFGEVAVDPDAGTIRVRRAVGVYGIGRVVNPRLALSQCTGGMIGGIGMAVMERTLLDPRDGRPVNAHMADYLVPVNLDAARGALRRRGRPARQSARCQGRGRNRARRDGSRHRQCGGSCAGQARARSSDSHRGRAGRPEPTQRRIRAGGGSSVGVGRIGSVELQADLPGLTNVNSPTIRAERNTAASLPRPRREIEDLERKPTEQPLGVCHED
jgi:Molybdopterin-binding domain of aldehyde dehydrogenase